MTRRKITGWAARNSRAKLRLEPVEMRLPDRGKGYFGRGRFSELTPDGRPSDVFGDVIVTVARVRAMEQGRGL